MRRLLRSLAADMGGTKMLQALQATVRIPGPNITEDILLITDGEVWGSDEIIRMMKKSGHRVFSVGVGSSVSEDFVRRLARETGGSCEFVVPNEKMCDKIVRHFKRIYLTRVEQFAVRWPAEPASVISGDAEQMYDGDTVHFFARFDEKPNGPVLLYMTLADGRTFSQSAGQTEQQNLLSADDSAGSLTRMAIYRSLQGKGKKEATDLAIRYQLVSPFTHCVVVDEKV